MAADSHAQSLPGRVAALDVFRGLVMFVLVSNPAGGFGFFQWAERYPESDLWRTLGRWFTHATWGGATAWDIVMPSFIFMIGVAMALSERARRDRGASNRDLAVHVATRSVALFLLGMILPMPFETAVDFAWPLLVLSAGLPWRDWLIRLSGAGFRISSAIVDNFQSVWLVGVLIATTIRLALNIDRLGDYSLAHLLIQVSFAYPLAFLISRYSLRAQVLWAAGILIGYWLAFRLYPLPPAGFDLTRVGVTSPQEIYSGAFAHWSKNTNLAAAFDAWFLNALPRSEPFVFNAHGYQTLNFVPTAVSMLAGIWAGRWLGAEGSGRQWLRLLAAGAAAALIGGWLGMWWCPIVKSIWTPSWTIFSGGCVLALFALCVGATKGRSLRWGWTPLVALGCNAIVAYVLALNYRWQLISPWHHLLGKDVFFGPLQPLWETAGVLASLVVLTAVMYRLRVFIRF